MAGFFTELADKYLPYGLQAMLGLAGDEQPQANQSQEPQGLSEQELYKLEKKAQLERIYQATEERFEGADKPKEAVAGEKTQEQLEYLEQGKAADQVATAKAVQSTMMELNGDKKFPRPFEAGSHLEKLQDAGKKDYKKIFESTHRVVAKNNIVSTNGKLRKPSQDHATAASQSKDGASLEKAAKA
jgi:hypothetical protein